MKRTTKVFIFFSFFLLPLFSFANELDFADELMKEQDYFRALSVLKNFEFRHRGENAGFSAMKKILRLHLRPETRYENIDLIIEKMYRHYPVPMNSYQKNLIQAEMKTLLGRYQEALADLQEEKNPALYSYISLQADPFSDLSPHCQEEICQRLQETKKQWQQQHPHHPKSEKMALLYGLIPGMGQVYAGNTAAGLASLALNAFCFGLAYYAYERDEKALALAAGAAGISFYGASIYAGYELTRRHNSAELAGLQKEYQRLPIRLELFRLAW